MDEKNKECSKFQSVVLGVVKAKLNLMLSEISQLSCEGQKIDFENNQVLVKTVLKKIADKKIKSVHITPEEAVGFITLFDEMESHTEQRRYDFDREESDHGEENSIYLDSPFK